MKPPFVISQIKWLPFPENKPEKYGRYYVQLRDGSNSDATYRDGHWMSCFDRDVIAFAELPTVDFSEEFDFTTAVELMKDGNLCVCNTSLRAYKIDKNRNWVRYVLHTDLYEYEDSFCISEILGKWRLA